MQKLQHADTPEQARALSQPPDKQEDYDCYNSSQYDLYDIPVRHGGDACEPFPEGNAKQRQDNQNDNDRDRNLENQIQPEAAHSANPSAGPPDATPGIGMGIAAMRNEPAARPDAAGTIDARSTANGVGWLCRSHEADRDESKSRELHGTRIPLEGGAVVAPWPFVATTTQSMV
jgi:hypothetical protein